MLLLYFLIAILATAAGSMTGMGGGVIMKPVLDALGHYDVANIGVLSSVAVFTMALVSMGRQIAGRTKIPYGIAVPLALGSVVGGILGQGILEAAVSRMAAGSRVTVVQNAVLAVLILFVFFYMQRREKLPTLGWTGVVPSAGTGLFLGTVSAFLGIGGGPVNVALMLLVFSMEMKTATVCSILTILFSQAAKLTSVAVTTGFGGYDLSILPAMVAGAVAGGLIGAELNRRLPGKMVERGFNGVQLVVLALTVVNILRYV